MPKRPRPIGTGDIERLREIARQPDELDRLIDGTERHPDAQLLDLCSEALHLHRQAEEFLQAYRSFDLPSWDDRSPAATAAHKRHNLLFEQSRDLHRQAKPLLRRITKMKAGTAAGIYSKALVVRASVTGAPHLAKSLAEELIALPGLRASLWPAGTDGDAA